MDVLCEFRDALRVREASFHLAISGTAVPGAEPCLRVAEPAAWSAGLDRKLILRMPKCGSKQYFDV